jgi:hypothetical protein
MPWGGQGVGNAVNISAVTVAAALTVAKITRTIRRESDNPLLTCEIAFDGTTWVDVTGWLREWSFNRGRSRERERMGAGVATVVLDNRTGTFDRDNPASPFAGMLKPNRPMRLRAAADTGVGGFRMGASPLGRWDALEAHETTDVALFTGRTEGGGMWTHISKNDSTVTWDAVDDSKRLNKDRSSSGFGTGTQLAGARVESVLDGTTPPWPDAQRTVDAGQRSMAETTGTTGKFDYLLQVAESEGGTFFFAADGKATFRDSAYAPGVDPLIYGDGANNEIGYRSITMQDDDDELFNAVTITADGESDDVSEDIDSELEYGRSDLSVGTILSNAPDMESLGDALLLAYSQPRRRIENMEFGPVVAPQVVAHELGDRVTVRFTPKYGGVIQQDSVIQGISASSDSQFEWSWSWNLSPVIPTTVPFNMLTANQASIETSAAGWTAESGCTVSQYGAGYVGSASLRLDTDYFVQAKAKTTPYTTAVVTVGSEYIAAAYLTSPNETQFVARIEISWRNAGGTELSVSASPTGVSWYPGDDWRRWEVQGTAPASAAYAVVRLVIFEPYSAYNFKLADAISLRPVV